MVSGLAFLVSEPLKALHNTCDIHPFTHAAVQLMAEAAVQGAGPLIRSAATHPNQSKCFYPQSLTDGTATGSSLGVRYLADAVRISG